ncbi:MAG: hypothetical protein ACRDVL_09510 [Acidimicrobiia bacterium]
MTFDPRCERTRAELSAIQDEGGLLSDRATAHLAECAACAGFASSLADIDRLLARGRFEEAPDLSGKVMRRVAPAMTWWSVAAAAVVGILTGALLGGVGTSVERVRAGDLADLFHSAGPALDSHVAELLIVERGWHSEVPERVYVGSLAYEAPETLEISLVDTTRYPGPEWMPNDLLVRAADGSFLSVASSRCPLAALPACQKSASTSAVSGRRPFAEGHAIGQGVVGPGRILSRWAGVEVVAAPMLGERPTIQIETTVAGSDLVRTVTENGAWRELHPTDRVLMWLDQATLVPLRLEVFAASSPERDLWELRRGYRDIGDEPIFIIELEPVDHQPAIDPEIPADATSAGFVDGPVEVLEPELGADLEPHRSGRWFLPDGAEVKVASWSDGRAWLRVEMTEGWEEPSLFGIAGPFAERIDLGGGSVGYLSPDGSSVAVHAEDVDVLVTGSLQIERLIEAAASLPVAGMEVPSDWEQAAVVEAARLPEDVMVPDAEGWSVLGVSDDQGVTLLLTGAGRRAVIVTERPGNRLDPPDGPDFFAVELDGVTARFDASAQVLEWVEDGLVIGMQSETVGLADLLSLAESMRR